MENMNHNFLKESVIKTLSKSKKPKFLFAISGGIDSLLLLKIASIIQSNVNFSFRAIHVNHNQSPNSKEMENHCKKICDEYKIKLTIKNINISSNSNIEDQLRNKRYNCFFEDMDKDEALVLAHHENDQFETFLYRLFRGSSPKGLSSIKEISKRDNKILCRPLLNVSKEVIIEISKYLNVKFVNDASNNDLNYDRNYIRKKIIPVINSRWKNINKVMSHNIELQNNYSLMIDDYCNKLYDIIINSNKLSINVLLNYPNYIYGTFLRHWVNRVIKYNLTKNEIYMLLSIVKSKNNDYPKCILKNKISIVRYNDYLHIVEHIFDKNIEQKEWDMKKDVGFGNSKISLNKLKEEGVFDSLSLKAPITLKPFRGNERMMLNKTYYQELKKIFQHRSIPIWERDKFILFYSHNELLLAYSDKEMFISSEIR